MTVTKELGVTKRLLEKLRLALLEFFISEKYHFFYEIIMIVCKAFGHSPFKNSIDNFNATCYY